MSYLVLARKYRPRTFADVVGQAHVIRPLENALKSGRIAHAFLFSGSRGVGKTTAARLLAMALNCMAEDESIRPCGKCGSCEEIIDGHGVDVFEIDGASNRGINEIRDLRETIKYLPSKGRFKVYIIDEVHMLTKEAFNALLKTLEEPPEHVIFIFATTEANKVLPTILSRCQRYDFKRITLEDTIGRLKEIAAAENITVTDKALRILARKSEGGMRDALSLFDQVIAFSGLTIKDEDVVESLGLIDQTLVADLAGILLRGDAGAALDRLDQVYNYGYDTREFAFQVLEYFRSVVVAKVSRQPEKILDLLDDELDQVRRTAADASLETLNFHFNAWLDIQDRLSRTGQPRLVLEALIVKLAQVQPIQPLAELVAKLESLLSGVAPAGSPSTGSTPASPPRSRPSPPPTGSGFSGGRASGSGPSQSRQNQAPPAAPKSAASYGPAVSQATGEQQGIAEPAPGPVSASPVGPVNVDSFMDWLYQKSPIIHSILSQGRILIFEPGKVDIAYGQQSHADFADRDKLLPYLSEFLGNRPELRITVDEALVPESAVVSRASQAERLAKTREQIMEHPLVKEATEMFSGEVVDIIPEEQ